MLYSPFRSDVPTQRILVRDITRRPEHCSLCAAGNIQGNQATYTNSHAIFFAMKGELGYWKQRFDGGRQGDFHTYF